VIFVAIFTASVIHIVEEYLFPGGFIDLMKRLNPRFASFVTVPAVVVINGMQLLLCLAAIEVYQERLIFSMSAAGY
jgi:hypothetical protein